jgi:hypothetical protein
MNLRRPQEALRRFSVYLSRVPSAAYFLAYLAAVPTFACVYASLPGAFYSSTAHLEPAMATELLRLADDLQAEILSPTVSHASSPFRQSTEAPAAIKLDALKVHFNEARRDSITGRILATVTDRDGRSFEWYGDTSVAAFPVDARLTRRPRFGNSHDRSLWIDLRWSRYPEPEFSQDDQRDIEQRIFGTPYGGLGLAILSVPPALFEQFRNHMEAVGGFPSGFWEAYPRMLYLSIVTITTLGFGDIVPLSPSARSAIGAEVIIGVVLVGLFLNSLAHESGDG